MKRAFLTFIGFCAGASLLAGCITRHETVIRDVERVRVEFESEKAAHTFYEALSKMPHHAESETHTSFEIPVILDTSRTVKTGDNSRFNEAVKLCDTNKDGKITEMEANIFAAQYNK